jgi:hypothetical protein
VAEDLAPGDPAGTVGLGFRKQLTEQGLDAGADMIGWHLHHRSLGWRSAGS